MTIRFNNTDLTYTFYINGDFPLVDQLEFYSHYSNTTLFIAPCSVIQSNNRYTQLQFTLSTVIGANHVQGLYQYIAYNDSQVEAKGVVKVYTTPGGNNGTEPYISNNEDREAQVYFRPQYEQ